MREMARLLRRQHALMAACRIDVHLAPRDAEPKCQVLGGLSHQETDDRIGQSLHQADHRRKKSGLEARKQRCTLAERLRGVPVRQPQHHCVGEQKRYAGQRIDAAGQHEIGASGANIVDRRIERLHAGGAIAHHRPAGHLLAAAHAQRDHTADVDLVRRRAGAAENHFVEVGGREALAQQQLAPRLDRKIGGGKRPRPVTRLEKRRSRAVDDVD